MNEYFLGKNDFTWRGVQTQDFVIYYQPYSLAEKNLVQAEIRIQKGWEKAKRFTKIQKIKTPIYFFVVDDRTQFHKLAGYDNTGSSYHKSNTIIESYFLLGESHEFVHLLTQQEWGRSKNWLVEGIAVYSDNGWDGKNLEKLCREYQQSHRLIPIRDLLKSNDFNSFDTQVSYPQCGSLVKYLILTYGWEKFLQLWKNPNLKKIYNLTETELERDWKDFLQTGS